MKRTFAMIFSALLLAGMTSCGEKESNEIPDLPVPEFSDSSQTSESPADPEKKPEQEIPEEPETEPATEHVSPVETVTSSLGIQQTVNKTIQMTEGSNTIKLPLADFIEEGDRVESFTFVIYSGDGNNIGSYKGGCGISVDAECSSATSEGWFQSENFTAPTNGTYGEITWNVPSDVADHVTAAGEVLFGYWWGDASSVRIAEVICNITRTREIPCDGTEECQVGKSVSFSDSDNTIRVPVDFLPEGAVPQAVTFNVSSSGGLKKFTGAFGYETSQGSHMSNDIAVFTGNSDVSLTWIVSSQAKALAAKDGELVLGYWWSEQPAITLDSISVKYSLGNGGAAQATEKKPDKKPENKPSTGFRDSSEIVKEIKVGWNVGNSLESYGTEKKGLSSETGWGNPKITAELIKSVKDAGFNAIRVPVTWGEHMDGDNIQSEWLDRVQEVVDHVYNNDMYVILNMHHDDYIWLNPTDEEYPGDSAKYKKIWEQIAERFKDYGDRLIFEGLNESRTIGSANEWMGGTAAERAVVNKYVQDFVNTVRASGGNNSDRSLIVTSYGACAEEISMNDLIVPNDDHIIVSFHYYAPWLFSSGQKTDFGDAEKSELDGKFDSMKKKFIDRGLPVIIDEFGCVGIADDSERSKYYEYYISAAKQRGIKCFVWDNNVARGEDGYAILNRSGLVWNDTLLNGIMNGAR